jgi:GNAT superfamily N-acetyltransferase
MSAEAVVPPDAGAGSTELGDLGLRPMRPQDAGEGMSILEEVWTARMHGDGAHNPLLERLAAHGPWRERFERGLARLSATDPRGSLIADVAGEAAGFAVAIKRERFWGLSLFYVRPGFQSRGVGRRLLEGCLQYAAETDRAMIMSSLDPRAMSRYRAAGFRLHPVVQAVGEPRRDRIPSRVSVRPGGAEDLHVVAEVDRAVRGASRADDIGYLIGEGAELLVLDRPGSRGYAAHFGGEPVMDGNPLLLGAESADGARELLWAVIAKLRVPIGLYGLTGEQWWAIDVACEAGLTLSPGGPIFTRGFASMPAPWLVSGIYF